MTKDPAEEPATSPTPELPAEHQTPHSFIYRLVHCFSMHPDTERVTVLTRSPHGLDSNGGECEACGEIRPTLFAEEDGTRVCSPCRARRAP